MMSQELGPLIDNGTLKHENPLIDPSLSFGYGVSGTVEEPAELTAPGCMIESASASARSLDPPSSTSQIQETHSDEYQRSSFEGCALSEPGPDLPGAEMPTVRTLRTSDPRNQLARPVFQRARSETSLITTERRPYGDRLDLSHAERPSVCRQWTSVTRKQMTRRAFQWTRSENPLLDPSPSLHGDIPDQPEKDEIPPVQRLRTSDRRSQMAGPAFHRVSTDTSLIVSERRLHGNRFDLSHAERPSVRRQRTRATRKQMALPSFQGARSEKCLLVSSPRLLHDGIPEHPEAAEMPLVRRQRRTSGTRMPLGRPRLVRASSDPYLNVSERRLAGDKPVQLEAELSTGRRRRGNSGTKMRMAPPELLRASSDPYLNVSDQRLEGDKPAQLEAELPIGRRWRRTGGIKMPVTPPGLRRTSSDPSLRVLALSGTSTPSTLAKDATMQAKGKRMSPTSTRRLGRAKSITSLVNQTCREEDFQHQVRDASGRRGLRKSDRENAGTSSGSKRAGDRRSKQSESSRMKRSSERSPISRRNHQRKKRDTRHNREKQMSDCSLRVSDLVAEHATRVSSRRSKRAKDIPKTPAKKGVETRQDLAVEIAQRKEMLKTMMDEQSPEESWSRMIESWGSET